MTFCLIGFDPEIGVAIASFYLAVPSVCLYHEKNVGLVTTQSMANPALAADVLRLMRGEEPPQAALEAALRRDQGASFRQTLVMSATGETAVRTGADVTRPRQEFSVPGLVIAGNMLGGDLMGAMIDAWGTRGRIQDRLFAALEAGNRMGGDLRGSCRPGSGF